MSRYAAETSVSTDKTKAEIERILRRYGATAFLHGWEGSIATVGFKARDRQIIMRLALPDPQATEFRYTPARRYERAAPEAHAAWEQACRQRWRALALVIKAKLEAIEAGITSFDREFMADISLPDGGTVGQWMEPQIVQMYETGQMPPLLPGASSRPLLGAPEEA